MKPVYLVLGLVATVVAFAGISTLISSVSGACSAYINALSALVFVVGSVAAAYGWVNGLGLKVKPHIKSTTV